MKERPILFSGPMVQAILSGKKTQTRRVVKLRNGQYLPPSERADPNGWRQMLRLCPYGQPGDRLWVRETHLLDCSHPSDTQVFRADRPQWTLPGGVHWRTAIHMRREASRITLEVTRIRVERLQEISEADAIAEGYPIDRFNPCENQKHDQARYWYRHLWDDINGPGSWDANPMVWVIDFKVVTS
jgi:hypothetical protein